MASTVVQLYLKQVLEAFYHEHSQVRITALNVVQLILRQGLVHPVQVSGSFTTEPDQLRRYGERVSSDCLLHFCCLFQVSKLKTFVVCWGFSCKEVVEHVSWSA